MTNQSNPATSAQPATVDIDAMKTVLDLDDAKEGSRAIGHDGPEAGLWEDYMEVPVTTLTAVAELIAADHEFDAAWDAYSKAPTGKGRNDAWDRVLMAKQRRAGAVARFSLPADQAIAPRAAA